MPFSSPFSSKSTHHARKPSVGSTTTQLAASSSSSSIISSTSLSRKPSSLRRSSVSTVNSVGKKLSSFRPDASAAAAVGFDACFVTSFASPAAAALAPKQQPRRPRNSTKSTPRTSTSDSRPGTALNSARTSFDSYAAADAAQPNTPRSFAVPSTALSPPLEVVEEQQPTIHALPPLPSPPETQQEQQPPSPRQAREQKKEQRLRQKQQQQQQQPREDSDGLDRSVVEVPPQTHPDPDPAPSSHNVPEAATAPPPSPSRQQDLLHHHIHHQHSQQDQQWQRQQQLQHHQHPRPPSPNLQFPPFHSSAGVFDGQPTQTTVTIPSEDKRRKLARAVSAARHHDHAQPAPVAREPDLDSKKMHQTSSRLLRMTDDDRPFTKDFKDLFSTLMVSLPLTSHRVRFQKIDHTFTSEEATTNLGNLKFSQSNRMPDPKDPSRIVTTTTTTTFSMAKEMARSVCQKFLDARFIESADGKMDFSSRSAVWQLTPKGMHILQRFCQKNGIQQDHIKGALESPRNQMKLVILEREHETDRLNHDQATVEVIFRRFVGSHANIKHDTAASDSDSLSEYASGLVGVKMAEERKVGDRIYRKSFTGKAATDWLMDCCTLVDRRETLEVTNLFVEYGLIAATENSPHARFQSSKSATYYVTERGQRVAGWITTPQGSVNGDARDKAKDPHARDSNANRMQVIVRDPALRLLFREYLQQTHCEENLSFYLDVQEFLDNFRTSKRSNNSPRLEFIRETLAAAYGLYNAFLAPGSPCELNIDHSLRIALASRMTRAVGDDEAMIKILDEVASLFDQAQTTVFKLMATDSVPKFSRDPKYSQILRDRNLDFGAHGAP